MIRQKDNIGVYKVVTDSREYFVELLHLQNNYDGNPRFEAHIIRVDLINQYDYCGAFVYRFTGHYMDDISEANFIVNYHEKKILKTKS